MRLLIVGNPYLSHQARSELFCLPYGYGIMQAVLKSLGHECDFIDIAVESQNGTDFKSILSQCDQVSYDLIIISYDKNVPFKTSLSEPLQVCRLLRNLSNSKIVLGGPAFAVHISKKDLQMLDSNSYLFDAVEIQLSGLMKYLGNQVFPYQEAPYIEDIHKSIFSLVPDFSGLEMKKYQYSREQIQAKWDLPVSDSRISVMPLTFTWGCQNTCGFCTSSQQSFSYLHPEKVAETISVLKKKYSINNYLFLNPMININESYLRDICSRLKKLDIRWSDCMRPQGLTSEMLALAKASGCVRISFGIETGSETLRANFRKPINNDTIATILRHSHELGIWNHCTFIIGLPHSTQQDYISTQEFIMDNVESIDQISMNAFYLQENCDVYLNPETYGLAMKHHVVHHEKHKPTLVFNEIDGLSWPARRRRTLREHKQMKQLRFELYKMKPSMRFTDSDISLFSLILLERIFESKQKAVQFLQKHKI